MKNQVYGTITLSVSMDVPEDNELLAMLAAGYKVNKWNFRNELLLSDLNVNSAEVEWESFYGEDE